MKEDFEGEWVIPERIEMHWIEENGESLGQSIPHCQMRSYIRAGWVGLYNGKWVEIFPGGSEYRYPN